MIDNINKKKNILISEGTHKKLTEYCKKNGMKINFIAEKAMKIFLNHNHDGGQND